MAILAILRDHAQPGCKLASRSPALMTWWLLAALTALMVAPVIAFDMPAMNDYPNHLARMYLLADWGTPRQNPYYFVPFTISPNLAMDIVVTALSRLFDVATATKAFLILSQLLIVTGAIALEIEVKGRHQFAGFAAAAMLYSLPFAWGFLNFEFGMGLALWGLAAWFRFGDRGVALRLAVHAVFSALLFLSHLMAFGLYGAILGFSAAHDLCAVKFDAKRALRMFALLASPALAIMAITTMFAGPSPSADSHWSAIAKIVSLFNLLYSYDPMVSVTMTFALSGVTAYLIFSRQLTIAPVGKWIAAGLLMLIILLPFRLRGGDYLEVRTALGAILILPAFLNLAPASTMIRATPSIVLGAIALINVWQTSVQWRIAQPEYVAMRASFAQLERGSYVLLGYSKGYDKASDQARTMPIATSTALAAHFAGAFVPTLFTIPGQQPLQVCPQLARLALGKTSDYVPVAYPILAAVAEGAPLADTPPHVRDWTHDYDYLYLVGPQSENPMPGRLRLLTQSTLFALYAIVKAPNDAGVAQIRAAPQDQGGGGRAECDLHP